MVANKIFASYIAPNIERNLKMINEHLTTSGGQYLCGDQLAAADIIMSFPLLAAQARLHNVVPGWNERYPRIGEYIKLLESTPGFKKSIAKVEELDGKFTPSL